MLFCRTRTNSPHIHTGFPGVAGKYIYCPYLVFSLYQAQGMSAEMSWSDFQQYQIYEAEKKRWMEKKKKKTSLCYKTVFEVWGCQLPKTFLAQAYVYMLLHF